MTAAFVALSVAAAASTGRMKDFMFGEAEGLVEVKRFRGDFGEKD